MDYLASLGYKSHNSSIKLKRRRKAAGSQGLSLKEEPKIAGMDAKNSSKMLDYFSNIRISDAHPWHDEYNFGTTYTSPVNSRKKIHKNMSDIKYYNTHLQNKMGSGQYNKGFLEWETGFPVNTYSNSNSNSNSNSRSGSVLKSNRNKVSISRVSGKKQNINESSQGRTGAGARSPKKFKITSLAQLLKNTPKQGAYLKNKRNKKNGPNRITKSNNRFRIKTKKINQTTPDHSRIAKNLSNYLKISTIKPFEPREPLTNKPARQGKRAPRQNINKFALIGHQKVNKKQLESYGFLDCDLQRGDFDAKNSKNKTADYFFKSKPKKTPKRRWTGDE